MVAVTSPDLTGLGTPEEVWRAHGLPDVLPPFDTDALLLAARVVVIAPHPDDEVLGVGGLLSWLADHGMPVLVVSVTDGERSHPGREAELRATRAHERATALSVLQLTAEIIRLQLPDSAVDAQVLRARLRDVVRSDDVLLVPWERDGHPDHDACAWAARELGAARWSYLVWGWHWATPEQLPVDRARQVALLPEHRDRKRAAAAAYVSQIEGPDPILPRHVLDRLLRSAEVLLEERT